MYRTGLSIETLRSTAKREPVGLSNEVYPKEPLSVKKRVFYFCERIIEFGPFNGFPSKSLMIPFMSTSTSFPVELNIA